MDTGPQVPLNGLTTRPWAAITGAARGIGAAIAERLAVDGFDLVLGDVGGRHIVAGLRYPLSTAADLEAVADRCSDLGARVIASTVDVRFPNSVQDLVALAPPGGLRAAVAAAGIIGVDRPAWELTPDELDLDLAVNLHGVANLARAAVPELIGAPPSSPGRFVAVVSTAGAAGLPRLASYVASKHAALGYVRSLASDLGPYQVTANAVLPGSTATVLLDRSAQIYGLSSAQAFASHQRLGRILAPAEIASAVGWLCGPGASAVTGAAIAVDGGFH